MAASSASANLPQSRTGGDFIEGFGNLNLLRQLGLMIALAASVAVGFAMVMWMQTGDYRPLSGRMDNLDAANVVDVLEQNQIKYKVDTSTGSVLVEAADIHKARLKLAESGLPAGTNQGFELMDKEQPLGTSQFVESARYQRSIEGELARTITSINSIRSARVHLAIPKKTVFVRDNISPTASVFVEVFAGRNVAQVQVKAIMNLVASSVPGMKTSDVTVIDQQGNLLSTSDENEGIAIAEKQIQYTKEVENNIVRRVNSILEPVVGNGRFRAEVSADLDFTAVEQAAEKFNPEQTAVRSEQTLNETRRSGEVSAGIPGALTNQPPGTAEAPEQVDPATGEPTTPPKPINNREQATRNYELDRTVSYTKNQLGSIKRLTVAVVVDHKLVAAEEGENTQEAWSNEELERLTTLVKDAVGYSAARGDSVNLLNTKFTPKGLVEESGEEQLVPWWQQWIMPNIKYIAGIVVIILVVFGLLRPMFKGLAKQGGMIAEREEARQLAALEAAGVNGIDALSNETVTLTGGNALLLSGPEQGYEAQLNAIKGLIADDPGRVAQVVKQWVNRDD
jgi:flagellar M-ring protein FliF